MFGLGKKESDGDKLDIQVHVLTNDEVFKMAGKLWDENARTVHVDETTGKEYLRFGYTNPKCAVWMQRDQGRSGIFELILHWYDNNTDEVYVVTPGQPVGDPRRAKDLLTSMLDTPSVLFGVK